MAKPKLALIPSGYSDGKIYSILPSNGDGDFTTTRASSATRINSDGFIENVATGIPRLDYPLIDGVVSGCPSLLLEPQRTNLIPYSEDFSNAAWIKQNVNLTSNYEVSPSGNLSADRIITTNTGVDLYQNLSVTANTTYKLSFYVKLRNGENLQARFYDLTNALNISYVNYSSQLSNDEWKRVEVEVTTPSGCVSLRFWLTHNSSSLVDASFWGAQLEAGTYATSYIPTEGTSITRLADTANSSGNADTFNDSEGVLMTEISALANDSYRFISLSDGTNSNNVRFNLSPTQNQISFEVNSGGSLQSAYTENNTDVLLNTKLCIKYKQNDFSIYINGFKVHTDSSGLNPIGLNRINFDRGTGGNPFYGKTKQLQYFNTILTDIEIEELTSWSSFLEMANGQQYSII